MRGVGGHQSANKTDRCSDLAGQSARPAVFLSAHKHTHSFTHTLTQTHLPTQTVTPSPRQTITKPTLTQKTHTQHTYTYKPI